MSRMQRWALVAVVVTVTAFVMGLLGGLTGNVPIELQPSPAAIARGLG
ncbi:MAG: hypothetical protein ACJA2H_001015 [Nitriliruptoraceae bacterium]|jgi:hypothetical protein